MQGTNYTLSLHTCDLLEWLIAPPPSHPHRLVETAKPAQTGPRFIFVFTVHRLNLLDFGRIGAVSRLLPQSGRDHLDQARRGLDQEEGRSRRGGDDQVQWRRRRWIGRGHVAAAAARTSSWSIR